MIPRPARPKTSRLRCTSDDHRLQPRDASLKSVSPRARARRCRRVRIRCPDQAEQRRQQGQRPEHGERDRDGRRDGRARQRGDADGEDAEQRDAHGDAGEQHRPAGGAARGDDRLLHAEPAAQAVARPGEDEQRVVDADPEADEDAELRGERGHADRVGQHVDDRQSRDQSDRRAEQRQQRGQDRAEEQQQHDQRRGHADERAGGGTRVGGRGDITHDVDLHAGRVRGPGGVDEGGRLVSRDAVGILG